MTCTTHHNACDCREAHFAAIALEREHWFSLANQRALDLASERQRVRGLEEKAAALLKFIGPKEMLVYASDPPVVELRKALGEG